MPPHRGLVAELVEGNPRQVVIQRKHHLAAGAVHGLRITQHQRHVGLRLAGEVLARGVDHPQGRLIDDQLRMRIGFIAFDQRKIVRNIGVQRRQLKVNRAGFLLPVGKGLRADFIDLIRRIDEIGRFVMRLLRADIPHARVLRGHHRQAVFNRLRIVAIGNIHHVESMLNRTRIMVSASHST
ncbi:Uncharacterised protein [Raoultella terrigena]|uniref:Uncharacterized protein n=1 Tax=Raoultella terrigena TaxID=577 RepID=A0A485CE90_RAOTE|nr:Uncharacterised protein [Raoultella terrigena]